MNTGIFKRTKALAIAGALALTASSASAGMLTTPFSSNNGYAGNMFDVTTFNITALDINTEVTAGNNVTVSLYTKVGSYIGSEFDSKRKIRR